MRKNSLKCGLGMFLMGMVFALSGCSLEGNNLEEILNTKDQEQMDMDKEDTFQQVEPSSTVEDLQIEEKSDNSESKEYVTYYVVNCQDSTSLYKEPDVKSENLFQMPLGAPVTYVESVENGFYKVIYDGNTGYALASYLSKEKPEVEQKPVEASPSAPTPTTSVSYVTYYVVNCNESITLRPDADVSSGEICQIPLGSAVSFIETAANGFYKIVYNGNTGYALASYLSTQKGSINTSSNTNSSSYDTYYVSYCNKSITLRTSPDVSSGEICQMPLGSAVSVVSAADNGFYYVQYDGQYGYALASYLSSASGSPIYDICKVVNCNESITLRPGADVSSGEIRQIPLGETVTYIGNAGNGFYEIYYMGDHGYAMADYLSFVS